MNIIKKYIKNTILSEIGTKSVLKEIEPIINDNWVEALKSLFVQNNFGDIEIRKAIVPITDEVITTYNKLKLSVNFTHFDYDVEYRFNIIFNISRAPSPLTELAQHTFVVQITQINRYDLNEKQLDKHIEITSPAGKGVTIDFGALKRAHITAQKLLIPIINQIKEFEEYEQI